MEIANLIKQKEYEKIIFKLRRHPITFIPIFALFLLLLVMPYFIYLLLTNLYPTILDNPTIYPALVLLASAYLLTVYLFFYALFVDYYLDLWIVTNDRIVDVEQHGLFSRSISELDLFRIQDATSEVHGIFSTLFNYGNLQIKTASENTNIIFKNIPRPNKIREEVIRLADVDRKYHFQQSQNQ